MSDDEIAANDRRKWRCGTGKCCDRATHLLSYRYFAGRSGRTTEATRRACDRHAERFATQHQLVIAGAPVPEPPPPPRPPEPLRACVLKDGRGVSWYLQFGGIGRGPIVSGACDLDVADNATLTDAAAAATSRLVADGVAILDDWDFSPGIATTRVLRSAPPT
jgi:hypothetical protein